MKFYIFEQYEKIGTKSKILLLAFIEEDVPIWIKTKLSSFKTIGGKRFGEFLKIVKKNFNIFFTKLEKFIKKQESCGIPFYISTPNFRILD